VRCRNPIVKSHAATQRVPEKLCCSILIFSMFTTFRKRDLSPAPRRSGQRGALQYTAQVFDDVEASVLKHPIREVHDLDVVVIALEKRAMLVSPSGYISHIAVDGTASASGPRDAVFVRKSYTAGGWSRTRSRRNGFRTSGCHRFTIRSVWRTPCKAFNEFGLSSVTH
jgi:hypothetical protein